MFDPAVRNWGDIAAIITCLGVPLAFVGLYFTYRQLRLQSAIETTQRDLQAAENEDAFAKEYRLLAQKIPTRAFLGETLTTAEREQSLHAFYHYIDLCNEQAYQARQNRIRTATWKEWKAGIIGNLNRPEFATAWSFIASRSPGEFDDLRDVVPPQPPSATH